MAVVGTSETNTTVGSRLTKGAIAGLGGGLVFGLMMGMMGMLPMIASLVGSSSAAVGFVLHMVASAIMGAIYALSFGGATTSMGRGLGLGTLYGVIWWLLGPLLIMPIMMGMGPQLTPAGMSDAMPSLIGHILFGLITGGLYFWLTRR